MVNGIRDQPRFRRNTCELRIGKQQLGILNLREAAAYGAVGVGDEPSEGIGHQVVEACYRQRLAWIRCVGISNRQTLHPGPQVVPLHRVVERQVGALLADIFCVDQDMARQFALDPEAPTLLVGRLVRTRGAQRTVGTETNIVQQPQRIPCWLNQAVGEGITKIHERSRVVGWIDGNHVRVLIETCAAVGDDTSDPGARLPVVDAIASAYHHLRSKLIRETEAWLEVVPVGYIVSALFRRGENLAAFQSDVHGLARNGVGVGQASTT